MLVYSSLVKGNDYQIYIASQNKLFKEANNGVRGGEIRLALTDVVQEILNAVFSLFTIGLRWLLPGLVLISLISMFGYKFNLKSKKTAYIMICIISTAIKLYGVYDSYYNIFRKDMHGALSSVYIGMGISLLISIFSYLLGSSIYFKKLKRDEDIIPFMSFALALFIDSILTQLLFTPFIM
jgi:hypothetical protein